MKHHDEANDAALEALLAFALAEGGITPGDGRTDFGSTDPVHLKGDMSVSDAVIEERNEAGQR